MDSGKTLTDLTVTLSFWIGIVLVLLSVHGNINDNATATPISLNLELQTPVESDASTFEPAKVKSVLPETSPEIHTEITGELKRGESFDLAMKRLKVSDSVRLNVIKGFQKSLDFKMLHPGDRCPGGLLPP